MKDQDQLLDLQTTDSFRLYLDEVGRHPLLTKEDEIELSQAYEAGLDAQLKLADTDPEALGVSVTSSVPFLGFRLQRTLNARTADTPEQRARLAEEGVPLTREGRVDWARAGGPWSP